MFLRSLLLSILLLVTLGSVTTLAGTRGHKRFACIDMHWRVPRDSDTVHVEFFLGTEPFARMTLSPEQDFRQFNYSIDAIFAEGRIRLRIDKQRNRGILNLDSLRYRCYSPAERIFSGELTTFDLPSKN